MCRGNGVTCGNWRARGRLRTGDLTLTRRTKSRSRSAPVQQTRWSAACVFSTLHFLSRVLTARCGTGVARTVALYNRRRVVGTRCMGARWPMDHDPSGVAAANVLHWRPCTRRMGCPTSSPYGNRARCGRRRSTRSAGARNETVNRQIPFRASSRLRTCSLSISSMQMTDRSRCLADLAAGGRFGRCG